MSERSPRSGRSSPTALTAEPWVHPGWVEPWWEAFGTGSLRILALRRDGRLVGVLPLMEDKGVVRSTSNWHTPEFGLLAAREELVGSRAGTRRAPAAAHLVRVRRSR